MSQHTPLATGTFESKPLAHLLIYAFDQKLTGSLVFEDPNGAKHALYLERGVPTKVRTGNSVILLGELLLELGWIDEAARDAALTYAATHKRLFGESLVAKGLLEASKVRAALREQSERRLLWLCELPRSSAFGYFEGVNFLSNWAGLQGVRVKPIALLWRMLRQFSDPGEILRLTNRLGGDLLALHVDAPLGRLRLDKREQAIVDVLRAKPQPLVELLTRGLSEEGVVRRVIYSLLLLRHLDSRLPGVEPLGVDEAPSSSQLSLWPPDPASSLPPPPEPVRRPGMSEIPAARVSSSVRPSPGSIPARPSSHPPPVSTQELRSRRAELQERLEEEASHYQILGVSQDASLVAINTAFVELAKRWHPDRLPPELATLKERATRLFGRLSLAHQVLTDAKRREEYDASLGSGSSEEQEQVQRILVAATAFQKAEVYLRKGQLAQAEREARLAYLNDPSQVDHLALVVWIEAQKPDADLAQLVTRLDETTRKDEESVRARWYRGQLLKRLGRDSQALADFRFVADRDPRHLEAKREIRLHEMRRPSPRPRRNSQPPPPNPKGHPPPKGILGKLFKR